MPRASGQHIFCPDKKYVVQADGRAISFMRVGQKMWIFYKWPSFRRVRIIFCSDIRYIQLRSHETAAWPVYEVK